MEEYTGVITHTNLDSSYKFRYPTLMDKTQLYLDSSHFGNCLRYVNDLENHNVQARWFPKADNTWGMFFITTR